MHGLIGRASGAGMWRAYVIPAISTSLHLAKSVLRAIPRKLRLDTTELGLVHDRLVRLGMQLDLELGKQALRSGDIPMAQARVVPDTIPSRL
jgi:hypothetical protein